MSFNNLEELRIFNQVVVSNGFTAASAALKLPTNIVSRKIAALENRLGVRLLNRTTRKISLTDEGRILFDRSSSLLQDFDNLESDIKKTNDEIRGVVKLAVRTTTVEFGLLDSLKDLLDDYPDLEIHLFVSDSAVDIVGAGIDLALMIGELPDSSLVAKKIGDVRFCLCASSNYIHSAEKINSPDELINHNYILSWQKKSGHRLELQHENGDRVTIDLNSRFQSNDVRTRAAAVYAGLGIGALPLSEVRQKSAEGKLVRVLPDYSLPLIPVWSVKSKEKKADPKIRLIENLLENTLIKMA